MNFSRVEKIVKRDFGLAEQVKFQAQGCKQGHNILGVYSDPQK